MTPVLLIVPDSRDDLAPVERSELRRHTHLGPADIDRSAGTRPRGARQTVDRRYQGPLDRRFDLAGLFRRETERLCSTSDSLPTMVYSGTDQAMDLHSVRPEQNARIDNNCYNHRSISETVNSAVKRSLGFVVRVRG